MLKVAEQTLDDLRAAREARQRLRSTIAQQALPDPEAVLKRSRQLIRQRREHILASGLDLLEPHQREVAQKAAKRFRCEYLKQGGKCRLSFEELYEAFRTNRSFGSIARDCEAGVTYRVIQTLYWEYFAELFPYANGFARGTKRAHDRRRAYRATLAKEKPKDPVLRAAIERAEVCGCKTKQVFVAFKKNAHHKVTTRRFRVNWNLCNLRVATVTNGGRYATIQCSRQELEQYDGIVVYVERGSEPPVFFVAPKREFMAVVFSNTDKSCVHPLFPLGVATRQGRSKLLAEFKEAWHLLVSKGQIKTPA